MRPAIFGLADGMMSLVGVVLYLLGHQAMIFPAALCGAISSAMSMAAGEWLSDSEHGLGASLVMGGATGLGALLPALPFAFAGGPAAITESVLVCILIGFAVACLRPHKSLGLAATETFMLLGTIFGVVLALTFFLPGGIG